MADEELRARERDAAGGGIEERAAWLIQLLRTRAPAALRAEAFEERLRGALGEQRQQLDGRFAEYEGTCVPCPQLDPEQVYGVLDLCLRDRQGAGDTGYGYEVLASYQPSEDMPFSLRCGVLAFAARLGDVVAVGVGHCMSGKPSPGTTWSSLSPWRESLTQATKDRKLRAWLAEGAERAESGTETGLWEILSLEDARLLLDLHRLPEQGVAALAKGAPVKAKQGKVTWSGEIQGIQPRLRLKRPDGEDEYFPGGYALRVVGQVEGAAREFVVGLGEKAQAKQGLLLGDTVSGVAHHVENARVVPVDFYRVSKLKRLSRGPEVETTAPPWSGPGPELDAYRSLTPRRLAEGRLAQAPCRACHWGARVQVEGERGYQVPLASMCFGPLECAAFAPLED